MKKILSAFCVLTLCMGLAACGAEEMETTSATGLSQETQIRDTLPAENTKEDSTGTDEEIFGNFKIEGVTESNLPLIDGSLANHPLLTRIYMELLGMDRDTAATLRDFNTGRTGYIWEDFIFNTGIEDPYGPGLIIVYEAPEDVKANYADRMDELEIEPLGCDGLVFLTNVNNPAENLSLGQIRDIYTDRIHNWSEVGGNDELIKPFQRNPDSGSQTLFDKLVMNGGKAMTPPKELLIESMGELIDAVANYDGTGGALGFSVYYYANLMYGNPNLKLLSVDGIEPTNESIGLKTYPLVNDFYVVIRADEPEDSPYRILRDMLLSDEGRRILEDENYVWARGK